MTLPKHSKGEWAHYFDQDCVMLNNTDEICHVRCADECENSPNISAEESIANAKLIAAAPDMLEALEYAAEYLRCNEDEYSIPRLEKIEQVLHKAKGE